MNNQFFENVENITKMITAINENDIQKLMFIIHDIKHSQINNFKKLQTNPQLLSIFRMNGYTTIFVQEFNPTKDTIMNMMREEFLYKRSYESVLDSMILKEYRLEFLYNYSHPYQTKDTTDNNIFANLLNDKKNNAYRIKEFRDEYEVYKRNQRIIDKLNQ